ncbi:MAG: LPS export ABC transporter permease LptF [Candidatus Acidiferrales bacterium]
MLEFGRAAMRILDRYVLREVLSYSLLGLVVFTFIFFVPQLVHLMELIVRHSGSAREIALLFACSLPGILIFTLPMAALVGVLIGLGRLSADSEIVALHACGIGTRRLLVPIGALAVAFTIITLSSTFWLGPAARRTYRSAEEHLSTGQASYAVQPRVFDERFPHWVLYVKDVDAAASRWNGIFLTESDAAAGSHLTLAEDAIVLTEANEGKLQLHLSSGSTHEFDAADPNHYNVTTFGTSDMALDLTSNKTQTAAVVSDAERSVSELLSEQGPGWRDARIEFERRIAFPAACLVFALLGVPLGVRPRRGGRAMGFVVTLLLICCYYLVYVTGIHISELGKVPPSVGVWAANLCGLLLAIILLRRIEQVRGERQLARLWERLRQWREERKTTAAALAANGRWQNGAGVARRARGLYRRALGFPLLMDLYILRAFFYYFFLMLAAFIVLFDAFTLFDLLQDISRNHVEFVVVLNYFRYLLPLMIYQLTPLAALVATLAALGVLSKNNEVTAFKASGISMYRLSLPIFLAGLLLAGGMFGFDDTFLPYANQRQDALRNEIKGRPAQTFYQPAHQWIFGENDKVYNYEFFDSDQGVFGGLNVFELNPRTFQLRRRIFATQANWEPRLSTWILEGGWERDFANGRITQFKPFLATSFAELSEPPSYFKREVLPSSQMNWRQLGQYIGSLQQAGFDTARLSVQWHRKFAFPLITVIIVFLAVPFALLVGTRGATGGLAVAVAIGFVYWAMAALFEAMGAVGQLPPLMAGWAPNVIFGFVGLYSFLNMPT